MRKLIGKLYASSVVRYVFFGGCTTLVNLVSFYLLRRAGIGINIANLISIVLAVLFAYVVNARFVFKARPETVMEELQAFVKFVGARALTMFVELGGVWLLVEQMKLNDMLGKFLTQFVVLILNYVFSKFFVLSKTIRISAADRLPFLIP